jgi:uncharacterized protein involved in exopolysaccharide biosynthesis
MNMMKTSESFQTDPISGPRYHYENLIYDTVRIVWKHKILVFAILCVSVAVQAAAFMLSAPEYTGEAVIHVDFTRDDAGMGEKLQSTASVDAAAVVAGAARLLRSRVTASSVVSALRLDQDPSYTQPSLLGKALAAVRSALELPERTPQDRAVDRLMRQITITNDPRSYLISVAVTSGDPESAAALANSVASEYLRGRQQQRTVEAYAAAEREMASLSSVFGPRHPSYLNGLAKLERLKAELGAARDRAAAEERGAAVPVELVRYAAGQSLSPAVPVMEPSGPNPVPFFALTMLIALAVSVLLPLRAEKVLLRRRVHRTTPVSNPGLRSAGRS